jgi:serine/threonine protein kinase
VALDTYGDYRLIKRLAAGGMAEIFLAMQSGLERFEKLVVLKRILPHLAENDEFVKMFLDEARIAARLNHPNIVQIFNLGSEGNTYFIAMEYIHGEDVRKMSKHADSQGKPIPLPLVCRIIIDAAAGLDYAHKKTDGGRPLDIVHRDVSPQNLLVTFEGGVKVVDFGIAKAVDQSHATKSGVLKGKYSYMSPEQAMGQVPDRRTDVFALGVILYELLTGGRLFKRTSDVQTLNAVTDCLVPPPSQANPKVPTDIDDIVLKALTFAPEHRYQEAAHLQIALEEYLLRHRLPSSSVQLAAYMQDLYAERLKREALEGQFILEEAASPHSAPHDESPARRVHSVPPRSRPLRPAASQDPMLVDTAVSKLPPQVVEPSVVDLSGPTRVSAKRDADETRKIARNSKPNAPKPLARRGDGSVFGGRFWCWGWWWVVPAGFCS